MRKITAGAAAVEVIKAAGINKVFGLLGGSMLDLFDALYQSEDIGYVGARDERSATHMADGYARISNRPGIVLAAQAGPGVANLVTGIIEARLAYSPVVAIAGMINRQHQGRDTFQEFDQVALFKPIAKASIVVPMASRLPELLNDAIRLSMCRRKGPVLLHLPHDVCAEEIDYPSLAAPYDTQGSSIDQHQIEAILAHINNARAAVIFAGSSFKCRRGSRVLQQLAEQLNLPVVATTGHADIMPHDHPLYAGQSGPRGNHVAARLTREADLILALGNRLAFNSTFHSHDYIGRQTKIIQIDSDDRYIGRYFPVELGIMADVVASTKSICTAIKAQGFTAGSCENWTSAFHQNHRQLNTERQAEAEIDGVPLHPHRALAEIRRALPENAIVTLDTGNACLQAADRLAHYQAPGLITPLDFGLVGFGYAAALGVQAAVPKRPVIAVMGDGGFGFTCAELNTAVQYQLPVIAVILDNGAWGAEKAYQSEFFGGRLLGADITGPAYDEYAELCGATGYQVTRPGELESALKSALEQNTPAVIHVKIDPQAIHALRKDLFTKK